MRRLSALMGGFLVLSLVGCNQARMTMDSGMGGGKGGGMVCVCDDAGRPANNNVWGGMANKFVRGLVNSVTAIVEWPMQTYKGYEHGVSFINNGKGGGSQTVGVLKGLILSGPGYTAGRAGSGLFEMATFWAANRHDNKGIGAPLDDEFAWEEGTQYSIFEPSLGEGIKPWGRKFVHGLANGVLGIAELPGQIRKGVNNHEVGMGIVKGFWYTLSRTADGAEAFMFLLPNPADNTGYAWEDKWAWSALTAPGTGMSEHPAKTEHPKK